MDPGGGWPRGSCIAVPEFPRTVNNEPNPSCRRRPSKLLPSCESMEPAVPWVAAQCWFRLYQKIEHC